MYTYIVTVKPNSGAFQSKVNEIEFDLLKSTETDEVYEVRSESAIDFWFMRNSEDKFIQFCRE